jgi:hypothetical protein
MAIIILLALILFSGGLASILLRRHVASWMPGPVPDNVIHISDWSAALERRRFRHAHDGYALQSAMNIRPAG